MPTLDQLAIGSAAIIESIEGDDALAVRLMEMGILEGEPIECLGAAPLGDPIEFHLHGYKVSLRKAEAQRVVVRPA